MRQRIFRITFTIFILLLASSCTGIKPFYKISTVPRLAPPYFTITPPANENKAKYRFNPSSGVFSDENSDILNFKKNQWKAPLSFPISIKFEFNNSPL